MERIMVADVLKWTGGRLFGEESSKYIGSICIDSRNIEKGQTYLAIRGERFDGHSFIREAFEKGARSFIKDGGFEVDGEIESESVIIEVEDTTKALADIARGYRENLDVTCIGITGSCGKTSTKTMVYDVLSQRYSTHKTQGNFNNHIGLPLTMLSLEESFEMAVFEMGMSGFGEIDLLSSVVKPEIAIITNIGYSHIENLGSRENILKAKLEIKNHLKEGGLLIVNGDDELLNSIDDDGSFKMVKFGFESHNDAVCTGYNQTKEGMEFEAVLSGEKMKFQIPSKGKHNIYNALAAICAGIGLGADFEEIQRGISLFKNEKMRLDIIEKSFIIINDAYNANPDSMKAAIDFIQSYDGRRKICILGDMLEMGEYAKEGHEIVGSHLAGKADMLITVGNDSEYILKEALRNGLESGRHFKTRESACEYVGAVLKMDDVVLVKGSRGMKMEEIVAFIEERSI